jgi:hypothetical protein
MGIVEAFAGALILTMEEETDLSVTLERSSLLRLNAEDTELLKTADLAREELDFSFNFSSAFLATISAEDRSISFLFFRAFFVGALLFVAPVFRRGNRGDIEGDAEGIAVGGLEGFSDRVVVVDDAASLLFDIEPFCFSIEERRRVSFRVEVNSLEVFNFPGGCGESLPPAPSESFS